MLESQLGDRSCPAGGRQDCSSSWHLARWRIRKNKQSVWDGQALVMSLEPLFDGVQNKWGQKSIVVQSETKCIAVSKMSKDIKGEQWNVKGIQCQVWAVDCLFCKYLMPNVLLCFFLFHFFCKIFHAKVLLSGKNKIRACHSRENSLVSQETKLPRTKSRRGSLYCSTTRRCLPTSLTTALPALFISPFQIWLNLRKIICDITWSQLRALVTNKQKLLLNW